MIDYRRLEAFYGYYQTFLTLFLFWTIFMTILWVITGYTLGIEGQVSQFARLTANIGLFGTLVLCLPLLWIIMVDGNPVSRSNTAKKRVCSN